MQETKQFASDLGVDDAGVEVLRLGPDLEYAATSLRSLLSSRHHVAAQEFFSGPMAQLLFEQASVKYASSQVDQFIILASLSSDAANPDASFSLALHYLAEYERILRHNRKHDIDIENGPIAKQIELWKTFWESVRYLWKAKGQGHPRARFLLFDLCSQITTVAQVKAAIQSFFDIDIDIFSHLQRIYRVLYPLSGIVKKDKEKEKEKEREAISADDRSWLTDLTIKLFLCAALSSSRFASE